MMKRALLSMLMFVGLALSVSAQEEEIHYYADAQGTQWAIRDFIDRKAMIYRFDGDSEDECTMEMRNYKKNGNTETFDIYVKGGYEKGKKRGSITIVTDPNLDIKAKELNLSKQTAVIKDGSYTRKFYFLTGKQYDKRNGKGGNPIDNVKDKAKDKAKDLLNAGKNLFKKKK